MNLIECFGSQGLIVKTRLIGDSKDPDKSGTWISIIWMTSGLEWTSTGVGMGEWWRSNVHRENFHKGDKTDDQKTRRKVKWLQGRQMGPGGTNNSHLKWTHFFYDLNLHHPRFPQCISRNTSRCPEHWHTGEGESPETLPPTSFLLLFREFWFDSLVWRISSTKRITFQNRVFTPVRPW